MVKDQLLNNIIRCILCSDLRVSLMQSFSSKGCILFPQTLSHKFMNAYILHVFVTSWTFNAYWECKIFFRWNYVHKSKILHNFTIVLHLFHTVNVWSPETTMLTYPYEDETWIVCSTLSTCNQSLNFYLYILSGTQFRNQFLIMTRCKQKKMSATVTKTRRNISTISTYPSDV